MAFLQLVAIVVDDYDAAIAFFVDALDFELVEVSATAHARCAFSSSKRPWLDVGRTWRQPALEPTRQPLLL